LASLLGLGACGWRLRLAPADGGHPLGGSLEVAGFLNFSTPAALLRVLSGRIGRRGLTVAVRVPTMAGR
jgi:hypothetical protein